MLTVQTKLRIPPGPAPVSLEQLVQLKRISSGFHELVGHLRPDDPDSEVDKVVKFILDADIPVRHINLQFADFTNVNAQYNTDIKFIREKCPGIKESVLAYSTLRLCHKMKSFEKCDAIRRSY